MSVEHALDEFIADAQPRTLILQGSWGRGKTHLWNARWAAYLAAQAAADSPARRYAYVSLFGLNSISEVTTAIGLASLEAQAVTAPASASASAATKPGRWQRWCSAGARTASELGFEIPYVGLELKQLAQVLAHSRAKELLVCLDDLDRRGSELPIRDVLGLISYLHGQRRCSVVAILNDGSLGPEQAEWDASREKVFLRHLTYAPTAAQCVALVFPPTDALPLAEALRSSLIELDLTNIRIIERVRGFAQDVLASVDDHRLQEATLRKLARSLALLTYCHLGQGEGAPPLAFPLAHGAFSSYFADQRQDVPPQEQTWSRMLDNYGTYLDAPIDEVLKHLVVHGTVQTLALRDAVQALEAGAADEAIKDAFSGAWRLWRDNFRSTRTQVVEAFQRHFPPAAATIPSFNADATFQLLRSMDAGAEADELMAQWLGHRVGARARELHPDALNDVEALKDTAFIEAAGAAYAQAGPVLPNLGQVLDKLSLRQGYNEEDIQALAATSQQDLMAHLLAHEGRDLVMGLKAALELPDQQGIYAQARAKVREVLLTLGDRSAFDQDRIWRLYGVRREA